MQIVCISHNDFGSRQHSHSRQHRESDTDSRDYVTHDSSTERGDLIIRSNRERERERERAHNRHTAREIERVRERE